MNMNKDNEFLFNESEYEKRLTIDLAQWLQKLRLNTLECISDFTIGNFAHSRRFNLNADSHVGPSFNSVGIDWN